MTFWSGERLRERLTEVVPEGNGLQIDCNAYALRMGGEIYVTPHLDDRDPQSRTKQRLTPKQSFTIPAGQFAFLLTEEQITMPIRCMGFISMRTTVKFKGLVNVSGFHVDPGYTGKLVFSVFNAGPAPIHIQQGDRLFLLWIADLDDQARLEDAKSDRSQSEINYDMSDIPVKFINNLPGEIHSLQSLSKRLDKTERSLALVRKEIGIWLTLLTAVVLFLLREPIVQEVKELWQSANIAAPSPAPAAQREGPE